MKRIRIHSAILVALLLLDFSEGSAQELEKQENQKVEEAISQKQGSVVWPRPDLDSIRQEIELLLGENSVPTPLYKDFDWTTRKNLHSRIVQLMIEIPEVSSTLKSVRDKSKLPKSEEDLKSLNPNIQLEIAMILVKQDRHDEALAVIESIDSTRLASPELAILFKSICLHKLVKVEDSLKACAMLMAHREKLPLRYQQITESLYNDLSKQKEEPLHAVARLMSDAGRRQNLQQQSDRVLQQEKEIVRKLDEIIKNLEQQKKQSLAAGDAKLSPSPSDPESGQSKAAPSASGSKGTGDVGSKEQDTDGSWGGLSAEQRAIAVKSLVRELPPHFRSLMKAYFQKLAEENK